PLLLRGIWLCHHLWRSAAGRHAPESHVDAGSEEDRVVRAPARASELRRIADGDRLPSADRDLLQLPVGAEADPATVGGDEGAITPRRAGDDGRCEAGPRAGIQLPPFPA